MTRPPTGGTRSVLTSAEGAVPSALVLLALFVGFYWISLGLFDSS
jgi:hypothetical protein